MEVKQFIKDKIFKDFPNYALINELIRFLNNEGNNSIWNHEMLDMITKYKLGISEKDRIDRIKEKVKIIADKIGYKYKFSELLDVIQENEPFNVANNPLNFGHLSHVFNVFWLGYYIINNNLINIGDIDRTILSGNTEEKKEKLNTAWIITSLFHDIGLLGEKFEEIIKKLNSSTSIYPLEIIGSIDRIEEISKYSDIDYFEGCLCGGNGILIKKFKDALISKIHDHGILSALCVYDKFHTIEKKIIKYEIDYEVLHLVVQAIGFHNLLEKDYTDNSTLDFNNFPLINLLIICDTLETWDRSSGFESIYNEIQLKAIELQKLTVVGNYLKIEINYRLHPEIRYIPETMEKEIKKIRDLIENKVEKILKSLVNIPKLDITFKIANRDTILTWKN